MRTKQQRNYDAQVKYRATHLDVIAERARLRRLDPIYRKKVNDRCKAWREKNKSRHKLSKKKSILKHKYGITLEYYNEMLLKQNGGCAICRKKETILCVDHCHKTKKARGLLCHLCNRAIGMMKEDIKILESAITYLKLHV